MRVPESSELSERSFLVLFLLFVWIFFSSLFIAHSVPTDLRWFIIIRIVKWQRIDGTLKAN